MELVALRMAMIMPAFLLQKSSPRMKTNDVKKCLKRRIDMWKKAQIEDLFKEAKALQQLAVDASCKKDDDVVHRFARLIFQGRLRDALRLLSLKL